MIVLHESSVTIAASQRILRVIRQQTGSTGQKTEHWQTQITYFTMLSAFEKVKLRLVGSTSYEPFRARGEQD